MSTQTLKQALLGASRLCKIQRQSLRDSLLQQPYSSAAGVEPLDFDVSLLDYLVCPLSKAPLRWDAAASELICDELSVAYKVIDGVPNLRPADGRVIEAGDREAGPSTQPWGHDADSGQPQTSPR